MPEKLIRLRYAAVCAGCGTALSPGDSAWHNASNRQITCEPCEAERVARSTAPLDLGRAGESAEAEGARRRDARIDRRRRQLGPIGAGLAWLHDPQHERAWRDGAAGERTTARRLTKHLRDTPVIVLHDRRAPGGRTNIDHLAVGPGGLTVIDSKAIKGRVRGETRGGLVSPHSQRLMVSGRDRTKLIEGVERQIATVERVLERLGRLDVDAHGCLCLVDADGLPLVGTVRVRDVAVLGSRATARLAARPGRLARSEIDELARHLASALPSG